MEKHCTKCGMLKVESAFFRHRGKPASWCKTCVRIGMNEYRRSDKYKATRAVYKQRQDVRERWREADRIRREKRKADQKRYRSTPRARLLHCRRQAMVEYRQAQTDERRTRLMELVKQYEAEIRRIDKQAEAA